MTRFHDRPVLQTALRLGLLLAASSYPAVSSADVCGSWEQTPTPDVGDSVTRLTAVTALSADDAWSVGYWRNETSGIGSLAVHWDGSDWELVELPSTGHLGTLPQTLGVDHSPEGDVWVAGYVTTPYPTHNLPLLLRWRDGNWDYVETATLRPQTEYPYAARGGFAYDVAVLSEDDAWAVGIANGYGDASSASVAMALHWDGSEWTDVEVPIIANRHNELNDVVAIASDDVWAVGDYRFIAGAFRGVTYHWDGSEWTHVWSPIEDVLQSGLDDVAASGPDDVWALGGADGQIILMHWDGSEWSLAEPPPHSVGGSLAVLGPNDVWVSGWNGYWHWDGNSWTEVPASVPDATYVIRGGAMEIVDQCDIWSVGFWTLSDGITSFSLAERLSTRSTSSTEIAQIDTWGDLTFPNPYTSGAPIRFRVPNASGRADLTVHDVRGRVIRSESFDPAALRSGVDWGWDGRTGAGNAVAPGVYFLRLGSERSALTRKLVLR